MITMAGLFDKENLSPVRAATSPLKSIGASPGRISRRGRSKSIGPGADGILEAQKQTSPEKDRRKSSFAPPVKSILPSKEDEAKRREARRKSLANRRVSFAPEATLHTWDVIEYMREATTSSTSSDGTRRASRSSQYDPESDDADIPATPEVESDEQRRKRRRSSVIPPLNFNDPDVYSSSPVSGSSPIGESDEDDQEEEEEDVEDSEDDDSTAMSLVSAENTADLTLQSNAFSVRSDSSARLEASLRQAAEQAGTRGIEYDEFGEQSEEFQEDPAEDLGEEPQSWTAPQGGLTPMARNLIALQEQENVNPFSPAFRAHAGAKRPSTIAEEEEGEEENADADEEESSMDMTRAVGGIVGFKDDASVDDMTMDFTQVGGKIFQHSPIKSALKRRRSTTDDGSPMTFNQYASGQTDNAGRPSKRRRSSASRSSMGDNTMEFTTVFGAINKPIIEDATMEFTTAIGNIVQSRSPIKVSRRQSVRRRRSSVQSAASNDQTMEFTTAIGSIKPAFMSPIKAVQEVIEEEQDEEGVEEVDDEMSMELTTALGNVTEEPQMPSRPTTPKHLSSPIQVGPPTTPKDQGRFKEAEDLSAKKLLTPIFAKQAEKLPTIDSVGTKSQSPLASKPATPTSRPSASPKRTPLQLPPPTRSINNSPVRSPTRSLHPQLPQVSAIITPVASPKRNAITPRNATTPNNNTAWAPATPERRSSPMRVLSSPFKEVVSPQLKMEKPVSPVRSSPQRTQSNMLDNIRTMSTPRKENNATPLKRLKEMTPRKTPLSKIKTPLTKTRTPRGANTTKEVQFLTMPESISAEEDVTKQLNAELLDSLSTTQSDQKVDLNEFLSLAGIKFMDLTATKRRYTAAPTPSKKKLLSDDSEDDQLPAIVAAGACTVPELDLYQHSCRELKKYISEGKTFLKQLEADVASDAPGFMRAYMGAERGKRAEMDRALVEMKTKARLSSKETWYGWRGELLKGLQVGLQSIEKGLDQDEQILRERDEVLEAVLPGALRLKQELEEKLSMLEQAKALNEEEDLEALEAARAELIEVNDAVDEQAELLKSLQMELEEQERLAEMFIDGKAEAQSAIEEANKVKEASRGISVEEVAAHQASVSALEAATGWTVNTATSTSLTMTYRSSIQLFFNPTAFGTSSSPVTPNRTRSPSKRTTNSPISLSYVDDTKPLTTEKRFFLQLLRAQLQMLDQSSTSIKSLTSLVSRGWDVASSVGETIRRVNMEHPATVSIVSDESINVAISVLLPEVQTKVSLGIEMQAQVQGMMLSTSVVAKGRVVYGEAYKEGKMGEFLGQRIGMAMEGAEGAVRELRTRLEKTGRKGSA